MGQLASEGIALPFDAILAECCFAKNALLTVGGVTLYQAVLGRTPSMMKDFEPASETMVDDLSGGVPGHSRHHMRVRDIALKTMVQQTAQSRLQRAMSSKTWLAVQQLDLKQGDLVDFWRKPSTKDDSGWRGPATVVDIGTPLSIKCQNRHYTVRVQDVRRAIVYFIYLTNSMQMDSG